MIARQSLRKRRQNRIRERRVRVWKQPLHARSAAGRKARRRGVARCDKFDPDIERREFVRKDLLRRQDISVGEVAERVGYGSASTFSTAFSRHVGWPPGRYGREISARETIAR